MTEPDPDPAWIEFTERLQAQSMSGDVAEKFRAITSQGVMNAFDRARHLPEGDIAEAVLGICQGIANSFAAILASADPSVQLPTFNVLIVCIEHIISKHPLLTGIAPHVTRAVQRAVLALDEPEHDDDGASDA